MVLFSPGLVLRKAAHYNSNASGLRMSRRQGLHGPGLRQLLAALT